MKPKRKAKAKPIHGDVHFDRNKNGTFTIKGTSLTIEGIRRMADICINLVVRIAAEKAEDYLEQREKK